jgi:hypothetical protein
MALKVGHLMSALRKIRSYRLSFDNQQNGMPLLFVKVRDPLPDAESPDFTVRTQTHEYAITGLSQ